MENKTKYLETSSVRSLIAHLDNRIIKAECFTSSLTLLELITDLKRDFGIRKNCIKKLLENISIDWQFPETIVAEAFPLLKSQEFRISDFQLLCAMVASTNSYEEFLSESQKLHLVHDLEYFTETDRIHTSNFVAASENIIHDVTSLLQKELTSRVIPFNTSLTINKREDYYRLHEDYRPFNEAFTIQALCESYAKELNLDNAEKAAEDLYNCYNYKIDFYVTAYSYYNIKKIAKGNVSSSNDRTDLEHFLYLRNNPGIKIVSNDNLIQNICEEFWPDKLIDPKSLLIESIN